MIGRRRLLATGTAAVLATFLVAVFAAPLAAQAQPTAKVYSLGILHSGQFTPRVEAVFEQGLRDLGWVKGRNLRIEYRSADGNLDRLSELATELVHLKVDLIVAITAPETRAARLATRTIPVVFVAHGDPVGTGDVQSLSRPGSNVTGFAQMHPELATKQLELLKELARGSRVAVLWNVMVSAKAGDWRELKPAAQALGIVLQSREIRRAADLADTFDAIRNDRPDALMILGDPLIFALRSSIAEFAAKERLLTMGPWKPFVDAGGLVSYGADLLDLWRRTPAYVDKIFKGTRPGDLPVEQPRKFELAINLKTAKRLGVTIPAAVLLRADHVIE